MSRRRISRGRVHLVIPDTQVTPHTPQHHLPWIGQYIVDYQPDVVIHLGDHWDMESLSGYDRGKKSFEGRRYTKDIEAGCLAFSKLNQPLIDYNKKRRASARYWPERHFLIGNHEERILRTIESDAVLDGVIGYHDFNITELGWKMHDFLTPVKIDGITYAHYFYAPHSGRPWGGQASTRLKNVGFTFTMGHCQGKDQAERHLADGSVHRALITGSCYLHDEDYRGPQANHHWRGVIVKHECCDGDYDLMEVSLDYLCRRYENMRLAEFIRKQKLTSQCRGVLRGKAR